MGLRIVDTVHRRSKYTSHDKYAGHFETISGLRVLAVRTLLIPTDEILSVLAVPAVQNPEILEAQQGVSTAAAAQQRTPN